MVSVSINNDKRTRCRVCKKRSPRNKLVCRYRDTTHIEYVCDDHLDETVKYMKDSRATKAQIDLVLQLMLEEDTIL